MSNIIETEILIQAAPESLWEALMEFAAYPSWNPFILAIEGQAAPGETLRVTMRPPGDSAHTLKPKVLRADAPEAFVWRGSLPIPGLFTGTHSFQLTRTGDGTRLRQSESFSGILVPLLRKMLLRTEDGFNQNECRAEGEGRSAEMNGTKPNVRSPPRSRAASKF